MKINKKTLQQIETIQNILSGYLKEVGKKEVYLKDHIYENIIKDNNYIHSDYYFENLIYQSNIHLRSIDEDLSNNYFRIRLNSKKDIKKLEDVLNSLNLEDEINNDFNDKYFFTIERDNLNCTDYSHVYNYNDIIREFTLFVDLSLNEFDNYKDKILQEEEYED